MRGLRAFRGVTAGFVGVCLLLAAGVASCSTTGTGARDEGPARTDPVASSTPSSPSAPSVKRVDAVKLLREDPKVSKTVKRDLKACVGDEYPIDVSYGNLTSAASADVVVNVMTCGDAVGVGAYVYRPSGKEYVNVFRAEEPPVYAEIDRGDLVVTQQVYDKGDPVAYPSGEEVVTYRWSQGHFVEQDRMHNDYSNAVGGEEPQPEEN